MYRQKPSNSVSLYIRCFATLSNIHVRTWRDAHFHFNVVSPNALIEKTPTTKLTSLRKYMERKECNKNSSDGYLNNQQSNEYEQNFELFQHAGRHFEFDSSGPTLKNLFGNTIQDTEADSDEEENRTLVNDPNESRPSSNGTLIADINQSVKQLRVSLDNANERLETVVHNMDKTLNETFEEGDEQHTTNYNQNGQFSSKEIKSTQTPCSWVMECRKDAEQMLFQNPKGRRTKVHRDVEHQSSKLRAQCKQVMRDHIEALREYMKLRVRLLHLERKNLRSNEKKDDHKLYQALMDEFDEQKRKIKAELTGKDAEKKLKEHCVQIDKLQRHSQCLLSLLNQILRFKNNIKYSSHNSSESLKYIDDGKRHIQFEQFLLNGNKQTQLPEQKSPNIPRLDFSRVNSDTESMLQNIMGNTNEEAGQQIIQSSERKTTNMSEKKGEEELEVISARSLLETMDSTQRTSAEIESIPEETFATDKNANGPTSALSSPILSNLSTSTMGKEMRLQSSSDSKSPKNNSSKTDHSSNAAKMPSKSSDRSYTSSEMIVKERINSGNTTGINLPNHLPLVQRPKNVVPLDSSITEEISEDIGSFKPSEKSLQSILSSIRSNNSFNNSSGRDSVGKRRRDSASEALLKLRMMNGVPELRSPRESKSPPKTPISPRGLERFMTKYPHSISKEGSFNEDVSVRGELLEELPNASQLGMVLDLSCSPINGSLKEKSRESILQPNIHTRKRQIIEEMAKLCWQNYTKWGTIFGRWQFDWDEGKNMQNKETFKFEQLLRQFCLESVQNLFSASSSTIHYLLEDSKRIAVFLEKEIASTSIDPTRRKTFCSAAVRVRAEKTSHVLLDTNRLSLAQFVYDQLNCWPVQDMLLETDVEGIKALLNESNQLYEKASDQSN